MKNGLLNIAMKIALIWWLLFSLICRSQTILDARSSALGQIIGLPGDPWAAAHNPAGLGSIALNGMGIAVSNQYLIPEINHLDICLTKALDRSGIGLSGSVSGIGPYLRQGYTLSYGRAFGMRVAAGVGLVYQNLKTSGEYRAVHAASFNVGLNIVLDEDIQVSFLGINPFGMVYSTRKDYDIRTRYLCCVAYCPAGHIMMATEVEMDTDFKPVFKGGLEYGWNDRFFLRMGLLSHPFRFTSGTGIRFSTMLLDFSFQFHSLLGFSPCISILYQRKPRSSHEDL